jgi:DHA1 family tetracycline resistance protein-like MFS transporter
VLFASRILDGFTGGNLNVAQAYISDVTDANSRTRGLGMIGAAFGLGFIIGPAAGGVLSQWGYAVPALAAAGLALVNLLLVAFWLPESLPPEKRVTSREPQPLISLGAMTQAARRPFTGALLVTRFFFGLAFAIFQTIFSLYALTRFNLTAAQTGYILTYVGLLSVFTQGFLVGRLVNRVRDDVLIAGSVLVMAFCLVGWALAPTIPVLLVVLAPTSLSGGLLTTLLSSTLTRTVQPQEIGGILGLAASIDSLTRIFAPALGGVLLAGLGTWAPGAFGALLLAGLSVFVWKAIFNHPVLSQRPNAQLAPQPVAIDDQHTA